MRIIDVTCGPKLDTFVVVSVSCDDCIFLPDAFTPNGDSRYDRFKPIIQCDATEVNMRIYNRWGNAVYISEDKQGYGDGTDNGAATPTGVYMYYVSLKNSSMGKAGV